MGLRHRSIVLLATLALLGSALSSLLNSAAVHAQVLPTQPASTTCHVTDGAFTMCPDGRREWSDIAPVPYSQNQAFLYQDQADLDPVRHIPASPVDTRMLLYEDCTRTTPLGPDEFFLISFDSVEKHGTDPEKIVRYNIHVFGDGTIIFFENGELQTDDAGASRVAEIDHQQGKSGFVSSPNCAAPHLVVEYQILLDAAGGSGTSPGPQFWFGSSGPPPPPPPPPRTCPTAVGASIDHKSSPWAAGLVSSVGTDVDKDGIPYEVELALGTDPCNIDTDGDGLLDPWEVYGNGNIGFDMNGDGFVDAKPELVFGKDKPDPLHKDVYVEVDVFDCRVDGCPAFDPMVHGVDAQALQDDRVMFAGLPLPNPDGTNGVRLHIAEDEHIPHAPDCDQPPIVDRSFFGTTDQRLMKPEILQAKKLAYRYLISGHSTFADDNTQCEAPLSVVFAALNRSDSPVPFFDNTPFGASQIGGRDMILSLSPLWICPADKTVPYVGLGLITVCDRGFLIPGLFPTSVMDNGVLRRVPKPYSRGLGRPDPDPHTSESRGITQLVGRSVAHLLGHSLGLESDADVANDPAKSGALLPGQNYWGPDPYPGAANMKFAETLYSLTVVGNHLSFTDTGTGPPAARENTVFSNPILEFQETDRDGDGVIERLDNCSGVPNADQADMDGDGIGDACDADRDGDGIPNVTDQFPSDTNNNGIDNAVDTDDDGDGVPDAIDNCKVKANPDQRDLNGNGIGDACDPDADGDGVPDVVEVLAGSDRLDPASTPESSLVGNLCNDGIDNDHDGLTDGADPGCQDTDGDSIPNAMDLCPNVPDLLGDIDGDHIGDACDPDADGDGISNALEIQLGSEPFDAASTPETTEVAGSCFDGIDNDGDGAVDGDDPRCATGIGLHAIRAGYGASNASIGGDGSTGPIDIGFAASFYGRAFSSLFVNENGTVSVDGPLGDFTPFDLTATSHEVIAPFFADANTSFGGQVTYGKSTVDGHPSFGVTWPGVACNAPIIADERTSGGPVIAAQPVSGGGQDFFQVVLVDRSDVAPGDFDIEFNYDALQWEAGERSGGDGACRGGMSARVGYSNGSGFAGTSLELPGSGVPGSFLDDNPTGLIFGSRNDPRPGRYVLPVRHLPDQDADGVPDQVDNCPQTANADQHDRDLNGIGDACQTPDVKHVVAAYLDARLDSTSAAEPTGITVADEPSMDQRLVRIVNARLASGLNPSARDLTTNLVNSLVAIGLVAPGDANALIDKVLSEIETRPTTTSSSSTSTSTSTSTSSTSSSTSTSTSSTSTSTSSTSTSSTSTSTTVPSPTSTSTSTSTSSTSTSTSTSTTRPPTTTSTSTSTSTTMTTPTSTTTTVRPTTTTSATSTSTTARPATTTPTTTLASGICGLLQRLADAIPFLAPFFRVILLLLRC